jgi:hypothetical protein
MSQTSTVPNLENPTTVDDFNALKALHAAQADALDAQARLIASQKALEKAQAANDPAAAQLAAATQAASVASQLKSLSDSQAAILKNTFTVPDSGYTGDIKPGDKAGGVEASLLAARAVKIAADSIVKGLGITDGDSIVLYGGSDLPDFQSIIAFQTQYKMINKALDEALGKMDAPQAKAEALLGPRLEFVSPAMIGAGLDAANKILGFFRTDYSIQGVTVTADDLLLINALADALVLSAKEVKVSLPALYNSPALLGDSPIVTQLDSLTDKRVALQQKVDLAASTVDALTAAAGKETDDARKKQKVDAAASLKTASDQGKVTVSLYDGLLTKITTPDDKAKVPLAAIIQQAAVRSALEGGAKLMTAKISSAGGTYYTRKNFWSFFGAMPFFTMGGVVVNYSLFAGKTGFVLRAGEVPVDGGFFKVGHLPKEVNDRSPKEVNSPKSEKSPAKDAH